MYRYSATSILNEYLAGQLMKHQRLSMIVDDCLAGPVSMFFDNTTKHTKEWKIFIFSSKSWHHFSRSILMADILLTADIGNEASHTLYQVKTFPETLIFSREEFAWQTLFYYASLHSPGLEMDK